MRRAPGGPHSIVLALTIALLGVVSWASPSAAAGDTWEGTWERTELPGKHLFLTQTGSTVNGHYDWNDASGVLSGSASGTTLEASFTENHYEGSATLTLAGKTFHGSYTGQNKDTGGPITGPFNGVCVAGACLANGASAPSEGSTPSTTVVPPPSSWNVTTAAIGLVPGGTAVNASPPLGSSLAATATAYGLDPQDVAAVLLRSAKAYCFLKAARSLASAVEHEKSELIRLKERDELQPELLRVGFFGLGFELADCLALAEEAVAQELAGTASVAHARSVAACPTTGVQIKSKTSNGKRRTIGFAVANDSEVSVSCSVKAGALTLRVASRSGKPLRKLIGPRLAITVAHGMKHPGERVSFRYHKG